LCSPATWKETIMQTINRSTLDTQRLSIVLDGAMFDVANILCDELAIAAGHDVETLTDADVIAAMRQPVMLAAVYHDLCERLGIQTPRAVRLALDS